MISLLMLSFRYYNLDAYHRKAMEKEKRKGLKASVTERTVFNDEDQRRYVTWNLFLREKTSVDLSCIIHILLIETWVELSICGLTVLHTL